MLFAREKRKRFPSPHCSCKPGVRGAPLTCPRLYTSKQWHGWTGSPSLAVFLCSEATSPVQSTTCEIYYVCYIYAICLSRYIAYIYIHTYLLYTWHKLELFLIYVFGAVIWYVIFSTYRANRLQSSSTHGAPMAKEVNDQTGTATPSGHSPQKASGLERTKPA